MPRNRAPGAPLALGLDGSVLLNLSSLLDADALIRVAGQLSVAPESLFIGTVVPPAHRVQVLARIDDAAAEVAARIQAHGGLKTKRAPRKRRT